MKLSRPALLALIFVFVAIVGMVWYFHFTPRGQLLLVSSALAKQFGAGGAVRLTSNNVPIDGKAADVELTFTPSGAVLLDIRHSKAHAKLLIRNPEETSWLHIPGANLLLVAQPGTPDFTLGDPAVDNTPLPRRELPALSPWQILLAPLALPKNWTLSRSKNTLTLNNGRQSVVIQIAGNRISRMQISGIAPDSDPINVEVTHIPAADVDEFFSEPQISPENTTRQLISHGILVRSLEGLISGIM
jgi:rhodanese-related sulfurtransferase